MKWYQRDGAVGRVVGPDEKLLGVEPVVVAVRRVEAPERDVEARVEVVDLGLHVGRRGAQAIEDGAGQHHGLRTALPRRADAYDRLGSRLLDGVQHGIGNFARGPRPRRRARTCPPRAPPCAATDAAPAPCRRASGSIGRPSGSPSGSCRGRPLPPSEGGRRAPREPRGRPERRRGRSSWWGSNRRSGCPRSSCPTSTCPDIRSPTFQTCWAVPTVLPSPGSLLTPAVSLAVLRQGTGPGVQIEVRRTTQRLAMGGADRRGTTPETGAISS